MSIATTLSQIKNAPEAIERALYTLHTSLHGKPTIPHNYLPPGASAPVDAEDIWIIPALTLGPASGHLHKRPDGQFDYDLYQDCLIEWELSTPRVPQAPPALIAATYSLFATEATRIRLCMDPVMLDLLNAALSWHHVTRLQPLGENMGFDNATGEDKAQLRWKCWVGILPTTWPIAGAAYVPPFGLTV